MLWLVPVSLAWSAPIEGVLPGSLYDAPAVGVDAAGVVHAVVAPRETRLGKILSAVTVTDDEGEVRHLGLAPLRHLALGPDGQLVQTDLPGEDGGEWSGEDRVKLATLDLDDAGRPVIAALGEHCPAESNVCTPRLWVSRQSDGRGFDTMRIPLADGSWSGLALRAGGPDGWILALHHTGLVGGGFDGIVRIDGTRASPWIPVDRARPQALGVVDGRLGCLYRSKGEVVWHLGGADGVATVLGDGARHRGDAVILPDGSVVHQHYDAGAKRLMGGVVGDDLVARDTPESGWHSALAVTPDGRAVSAWYVYRNSWNKGIRMGLPGTGEQWTIARSEDENLGWGLDLDIGPQGVVGLVAHDRSQRRVKVLRWPALDAVRADAVPDAGDWTDRRRTSFLFAYGGGWYQWWGISTAPPSTEDFVYGAVAPTEGRYGVSPGLGIEGGFAGRVGPVNLVVEYMRRNDDDEAVQTIHKLQNLMAKIGIDDIPAPDTEMQLHLRTADLDGTYTGDDGTVIPFTTSDRMVELRYVGKEGYHLGLRYHGFSGPQDVAISEGRTLTDAYVADARFTEGAFVVGWAVLDYLKKYETRYLGPAVDAQIGLGLVSARFTPTNGGTPATHLGLTIPAQLELSVVAYRRLRSLKGAGGFARLGVRGMGQYTGAAEPTDREEITPYANFVRLDGRFGPWGHLGFVF